MPLKLPRSTSKTLTHAKQLDQSPFLGPRFVMNSQVDEEHIRQMIAKNEVEVLSVVISEAADLYLARYVPTAAGWHRFLNLWERSELETRFPRLILDRRFFSTWRNYASRSGLSQQQNWIAETKSRTVEKWPTLWNLRNAATRRRKKSSVENWR
jgi:hypothetical protein